ncbi:MAG: hypothetical protein ACM3N9_03940 [Syntrophothermus sp.]
MLLILPVSDALMAQPYQPFPRSKVQNQTIFVRETRSKEFSPLKRDVRVKIVTKNHQHIDGRIKRVKNDTIFFQNQTILASDIDSVVIDQGIKGRRLVYVSGSDHYQIEIPPPETNKNIFLQHKYAGDINKEAKRDANQYLDETQAPLEKANFVKLNIAKIFHLELALAYERRLLPKLSWETEISGIVGIPDADAYYNPPYRPFYNYDGFSITTYPKWYIINKRSYCSFVLMYRYLQFYQVRSAWPDKNDYGVLQDQFRNDLALSIRIGNQRRYGSFVLDWYVGGGLKIMNIHELAYAGYMYHDSGQLHYYNEDHSPVTRDWTLLGPVFNAGLKMGFGF